MPERNDDQHADQVRERREETEREAEAAEQSLTAHEQDQAVKRQRLSALTIYAIVRREGDEELGRPAQSLWWSGIAAGLCISVSVVAEGALHHLLEGYGYRPAVENLGYTFGFVLVVLSRLQLFTENTITVVLPILAGPTRRRFLAGARLWSLVFLANMAGAFLAALIISRPGVVTPEHAAAMFELSTHYIETRGADALLLGIPAGFLIAALVWMLPSARGAEFFIIVAFTYLIAAAGFTHVVAGAVEVFITVLSGGVSAWSGIFQIILPTFVGNVLGGTGLFAVLAYAQVHEEM